MRVSTPVFGCVSIFGRVTKMVKLCKTALINTSKLNSINYYRSVRPVYFDKFSFDSYGVQSKDVIRDQVVE